MRTAEERIKLLHSRASELKRVRDRKRLYLTGCASVCLFTLLFTVLAKTNYNAGSPAGNSFAGSSMLKESAGGYVLFAVISFVAAVAITLVCIQFRNNRSGNDHGSTSEEDLDRRSEK